MTTSTWLPAAAIALLAGAAGAAIALYASGPRAADGDTQRVVAPTPEAAPDEALLDRLDELERRLASLELRPAPAAREVAVTGDSPVEDAPRSALGATPSATTVEANPVLIDEVAVALESIRERERVEKEAERERIIAQKVDAELEVLAQKLNLGAGQVNDMRELYFERRALEQELTRLWEEGHDVESLGRMKQDGFASHEQRLDEILTPDQREGLARHRDVRRAKGNRGK